MIWKVFTCGIREYPETLTNLQKEWNIVMLQFFNGLYYITCNRLVEVEEGK